MTTVFNFSEQEVSLPVDELLNYAVKTGTIFSATVEVTPDFARELLQTNINNRNVLPAHVKALAREMAEGRWEENGQPIIMTEKRRLIDGQNRLLAVILSGVTIRALLVIGVSDDFKVRKTLDQGKNRSVANILQIAGFEANQVAERISSLLLALDPDYPIRMSRPSKAEYLLSHLDEIEPWADWSEAVSKASPVIEGTRRRNNRSIGAATAGTLGVYLARNGADTVAFQEFMDGAAQNLGLEQMRTLTPNRMGILNLVNRRLRHGHMLGRPNGGSALYPTLTEMDLYIRTFNRYMLDEKVEHLKGVYTEDLRWLDDLPKPVTGGKR